MDVQAGGAGVLPQRRGFEGDEALCGAPAGILDVKNQPEANTAGAFEGKCFFLCKPNSRSIPKRPGACGGVSCHAKNESLTLAESSP